MANISIIVRTYNEERWIGQCLQKVRKQTIDDQEVILVDNKSTDKTIAKARSVYPDLNLVEIDEYRPGLAINEGVRASNGEYIACLSAHCLPVDETWLEHLLDGFGDDEVAGVYGRQLPLGSSDPIDKRDLIRTFGPERLVQTKDTFFHNANSMIRRDVWEEYPFSEEVTNIEDQIWGNVVISAGYKLVYEPRGAVYHHHGINQGNEKHRTKSVVNTMEQNELHADDDTAELINGNPLDPESLNIVSLVPVRREQNGGVDADKSLVRETIDSGFAADYIDDVIVATDSKSMADEVTEWGAKAPFLRPPELSADDVGVIEVFKHAVEQIEASDYYPDLVVLSEITHPFRPPGLLDDLVDHLVTNGFDTVVASYPEYRPCLAEDEDHIKDDQFYRLDHQLRRDRDPIQIGLPGLGCVTYPSVIRTGERFGEQIGVYEIENPIATIEIRDQADLPYWEQLSSVLEWTGDD